MAKRKRLNIVRKSGKSQTDKQLVGSSNNVNHNINEEYAQSGVDTRENLMVASLNHQNYQSQPEQQIQVGSQVESHISFNGMSSLPKDTILRRKRSSAVRKSSNSQAKEKQILDSSNEVNQNKYSYSKTKEFAQFEADTTENLMLASLNRQNDVPQSEQQIYMGSHVEYPNSFSRMDESLPKDTIGRHTTRLSARKSGKAQAEEQLINSSNAVNRNNHNINVKYAQIGRGTKGNLMVASLSNQNDESQPEQQFQVGSLPKDTIGRNMRFKAVQKGGKARTKEPLIDSSEVRDTREKLMAGSLSHQNHESQPEQQIQVGSHAEYPISFGRMGKSLPKDTMGRRTRLKDVRKIGKAQAEEQLFDSYPAVNQTNYNIHEKSAQFGGVSAGGNLKVASLNHQSDQSQSEQVLVGSHVESPISFDTTGKRRRLNTVRKSGIAQAEEQLIDSSNAVNENNHNMNEKSAQLGGASLNHQNYQSQSEQVQVGSHVKSPISFGRMNKRLPNDTMGKHRRLNSVRKSGKAQAEEQLIDSSNAVNQNNNNIYEKSALGGVSTSGNLMGASLNHHNVQSQSEQVQVGSHVDSPISFGRMSKRLPKDTMARRKRPTAVQKSGRSQAEKQSINSSIEVNRNNHNINEERDQFVGDTRGNLMAASLTHQSHRSQSQQQVPVENQVESPISFGRMGKSLPKDTMGKGRRLNAVRKSGKAQAEEQLINSFNTVNQNNHNMHENSAQLVGGNLMGASLNHRNDQSQSEQVQVESHVESPISFDRMSKRLPRDTMERRKRPNAVRKSGRSQAEKQLIDSSFEVNQNNHNINEECDQFVGANANTRGNLMVASHNHQSDRSPSQQQIPLESRVENSISFVRVRQSLSKGQTRVRGYSRMLDVWNLPDGEFIRVEVDSLGNPIEWEGKKLLNAIGSLARKHQYAPINILSWKDMPELNITNMLDLIQSKFHFVPTLTDQTKQILKDNLSAKWRQFKHDLKEKGYDENKTEEEMAANIPDRRVDPSQYRALVHHWCSQKGQKISNINKRNRSKYEDVHCMGTKSLPRFIHEVTEANGVQPSRAEIYIQTRTRKDGRIVTEKAANVIGELKKHMVETSSSCTPQMPQDSTNWANDIYSKVRGPEKRGSVRCLGKVPRVSNTSSQSPNVENRVIKLENLLGNLVSVLQTRFSADQQINDVLQAIAQEVPAAIAPSTPNDSSVKLVLEEGFDIIIRDMMVTHEELD
ncbi:unnamed protein product [Vicia faba]|uniref:Uncharacterized protein n=1 Tax=Vicia faba TaxID=3906 RepID=A0AAV0YQ13_VICFA|nr:unnamed protein product [Vicia faba]